MYTKAKKKWVKALRSGKYRQGKHYLKRTKENEKPEYCCLGVFCEVMEVSIFRQDSEFTIFGYDSDASSKVIPEYYRDKYGIEGRHQTRLILLNDGGSSFDEIAEYIGKEM